MGKRKADNQVTPTKSIKGCLQIKKCLQLAAQKMRPSKTDAPLQLQLHYSSCNGHKRKFYENYNNLPTKRRKLDSNLIQDKINTGNGVNLVNSDNIFKCFELASNNTLKEALGLPESEKKLFITKQQNFVCFVGLPGLGKSTLCKMLIAKVLDKEVVGLTRTDWIFYISLKSVDLLKETTLVEFLLSNSVNKKTARHLSYTEKNILKSLEKSSSVLIVLDGLGVLELQSDSPSMQGKSLLEKQDPIHLIQGLLKSEILPNAKKLITTTPAQYKKLDTDFWPLCVVEILGWSSASQQAACSKICGKLKDKVGGFLLNRPDITHHCSSPADCILILSSLHKALSSGEAPFVKTMEHIFIYGLCKSFRKCFFSHSGGKFENLASGGWNIFTKSTKTSNRSDSEKPTQQNHKHAELNVFASKGSWKLSMPTDEDSLSNSSPVWQHLFAAAYLMFSSTYPAFTHYLQCLKLGPWKPVSRFVFALCNEQLVDLLASSVPDQVNKYMWNGRRDLLHNYFCKQLKNLTIKNKSAMLKMLTLICEVNDDSFLKDFLLFLPKDLIISGNFTPREAMNIETILNLTEKEHNIFVLSGTKFSKETLGKLLHSLHQCAPKVNEIHLQKALPQDMMQQFVNEVPTTVDKLAISLHFPEEILKKILKIDNLTCVDLSESCIRASTISIVSGYVFKISKLLLPLVVITWCCLPEMSSIDVSQLCRKKWNEKAPDDISEIEKEIYFSLIEIRKPGIHLRTTGNIDTCALSLVLHRITSLKKLEIEKASGFAMQQICRAVKNCPFKIDTLEFDGNRVDDKSADAISECIHNGDKLSFFDCNLTTSSLVKVATAMSVCDKQFMSVKLDRNTINEKGAVAVAKALPKMKTVSMQFCNICCVGMDLITNEIKNLSEPMESFTLGWNTFPNEMAHGIGSCLNKFQHLSLRGCGAAPEAMEILADYIIKLDKPIPSVDFSKIVVNENVAKSLLSCFHNIKALILSESHVFREAKPLIEEKLKTMPDPKPTIKFQSW